MMGSGIQWCHGYSYSPPIVATHSVLNLVQHGGLLLLVANDFNGNIYTHGYDATTGRRGDYLWIHYSIQGTSNGSTQAAPLQARFCQARLPRLGEDD